MKARLYFLDRLGWPVERLQRRWFQNALRLVIHTRKITAKRPACLDAPDQCANVQRQP